MNNKHWEPGKRSNGHGWKPNRENQAELGRRFRQMLGDLGLNINSAAELLRVSPRTVQRWVAGSLSIPYSAYKCVRLMRRMELPGREWDGWVFHSGALWTPEGISIRPEELSWWGLMVRKARLFHVLYERQAQFDGAVDRARAAAEKISSPHELPPALAIVAAIVGEGGA